MLVAEELGGWTWGLLRRGCYVGVVRTGTCIYVHMPVFVKV